MLCAAGAAITLVVSAAIQHATGLSLELLVAVILGIIAGNLVRVPRAADAGVLFTSKKLLRVGVGLLGLSVPAAEILDLGWMPLVTVGLVVTIGLLAAIPLGRAFGLTREQSLLIGAGCSICGAAAIAAVEGITTRKRQHEFITAIAVIVLLGTLMIGAGPLAAHLLGWDNISTGVFLGASTHEVSQAVAAGQVAGAAVLPIAVTVKLARVLCLGPMMALLAVAERRHVKSSARPGDPDVVLPPLIPVFVIGFVSLVLVRTFVAVPEPVIDATSWIRTLLFSAAMFAQGLGVTAATITTAGHKPFAFGGILTLVVIAISATGAVLV